MIACNACQLLATDLPFCHGPSSRPFLGPSISILIRVIFIIVRVLFKLVSRDSSKANMRCVGTPPRGRSYRKLRGFCNLRSLVYVWFFDRFMVLCWVAVRFNLVFWGGCLVSNLMLSWVMLSTLMLSWGIFNFWSWVVEQVLLFIFVLESNLRDLTWHTS